MFQKLFEKQIFMRKKFNCSNLFFSHHFLMFSFPVELLCNAIPANRFDNHWNRMSELGNRGFREEFRQLQKFSSSGSLPKSSLTVNTLPHPGHHSSSTAPWKSSIMKNRSYKQQFYSTLVNSNFSGLDF